MPLQLVADEVEDCYEKLIHTSSLGKEEEQVQSQQELERIINQLNAFYQLVPEREQATGIEAE